MLRIIDGFVFKGSLSPDEWVVTTHDLGNGQHEACVQRKVVWEEDGRLDPDSIAAQVLRGEREDPEAEAKRRANLMRAARRGKSKVRRLCKAFGCDTMLTLTYRENQTEMSIAKKHVAEFVRRIKRLMPGFRYVACYEQQERGAWHVHMAIRAIEKRFKLGGVQVKSYDAVRSVWRGVVGLDNGNIDISDGQKKNRKRPVKRSPARLAAYMSKYMLKDFEEGAEFVNRYSSSEQASLPKPARREVCAATMQDLVAQLYGEVGTGDVELFTWLSKWGDVFYIAVEPRIEHQLRPWEV